MSKLEKVRTYCYTYIIRMRMQFIAYRGWLGVLLRTMSQIGLLKALWIMTTNDVRFIYILFTISVMKHIHVVLSSRWKSFYSVFLCVHVLLHACGGLAGNNLIYSANLHDDKMNGLASTKIKELNFNRWILTHAIDTECPKLTPHSRQCNCIRNNRFLFRNLLGPTVESDARVESSKPTNAHCSGKYDKTHFLLIRFCLTIWARVIDDDMPIGISSA